MASDSCNRRLLQELITEILYRLPVKTLMRFKCVSKRWYDVIENYNFIMKNFNRRDNNPHLLVRHYTNVPDTYAITCYDPELLVPAPYNFDVPEIPNDASIIGPVDGIYFVHGWDHPGVFLWNPAAKELRPVPEAPYIVPSHFTDLRNTFGFGIDLVTKHYKLVWIRSFWDRKTDGPYMPKVISIYNLSTDSWRAFEMQFRPFTSFDSPLGNTYMNGCCYWKKSWNRENHHMAAFDMNTETFREFAAPYDFPKTKDGYLSTFNGFIALFILETQEVGKFCELWVMKEESIWIKHTTIGPLTGILRPVKMLANGDFFLETDGVPAHLALYKNDTKELIKIGEYDEYNCLEVFIYKESLLSVMKLQQYQEGNS